MKRSLIKKYLIFLLIIVILFLLVILFYKKNIEKFEDTDNKKSMMEELVNLPILDATHRFKELKAYLDDPSAKLEFHELLKDKVNIIDDYRNIQTIFKLNDIKLRMKYNPKNNKKYIISSLAIDKNKKIINVTNLYTSYWAIIKSKSVTDEDAENVSSVYNELTNENISEIIDQDVFLFFNSFAYAPVHNLDNLYNTLYFYKKNKMKSKLLVIKSDNYFYNQSLISLKKHFNLEYIYLDFNKTYLFKNFYCTREYMYLQKETKKFIDKEYLGKIMKEYRGKPYYDNIAIIKYVEKTNVSTYDTFDKSKKFFDFCKKNKIVDLNINYKNDLEYKIYLINKAKKIIVNYYSPYIVNIYKHCISFDNKEIFVINGGNNQQIANIEEEFEKKGENIYSTYGRTMKGEIFNNIKTLDEMVSKLEKYF